MENEEVSKITMWAMIAVALFFDGIQILTSYIYFIPFVGFFLEWAIASGVSIFAFLTFFLWFHLAGIKFNAKIASTTAGAFFIELIPLLSALPTWTLSVIMVFLLSKTKKIVGAISPEAGQIIDKVDKNKP